MTVLSVINGLAQMVSNPALRPLASLLLTHCRVQSHDVNEWVQSPRGLLNLGKMVDHYYGDEGEEEEARAFLRYAGGDRSSDTMWHVNPTPDFSDKIHEIIKPQIAKGLSRIVLAVDQAQPDLLQFPAGRYVRHIDSDGNLTWAEIAEPFTIADRPVTYNQFLGLAHYIGLPPLPGRQGSMVGQDPVLNVSQNCMDEWIRVLGLLSGVTYRPPKEKEWERATCKNLPIVELTEKLVSTNWHRRYANAFIPAAPGRLALSAGLIINNSKQIVGMLRDGIALSAWDFTRHDMDNDDVNEVIFLGENEPPMMRRIGYRYHQNPEALRKERKKREKRERKEKGFCESRPSAAFRLAVGQPQSRKIYRNNLRE